MAAESFSSTQQFKAEKREEIGKKNILKFKSIGSQKQKPFFRNDSIKSSGGRNWQSSAANVCSDNDLRHLTFN